MYIISEAIFKGQSKTAKIAGYTSFSKILCDIFKCYNLTCDATTNTYLKKAYFIKSNKKPQNKFDTLLVKNNKDFYLLSAVYIGGEIDKLSVEYNLSGEYKQTFI